jgi:hypothetical protein
MFKFNKNYKDTEQVRKFFEEFKAEYKKIKEAGEYPYNDRFKGKIKGIEGEDEDRAIYLLQHLKREEEKRDIEEEMIKKGWVKLSEEIVKEAIEKEKKIQLSTKTSNDWLTFKVDKVLKPHCFNGKYGLMELKARTRGYSLNQFEDAFCKLV